jgi:hypothetical protein
MVSLARISGVRSGLRASSIGVGTVTMKIFASRRRSGSSVHSSLVAAANSSGSTSSVLSRPSFSSAIRAGFLSKPITVRLRANSTASGRPT